MGGLVEMITGGSAGQKPTSPDYAALKESAQGAQDTSQKLGQMQMDNATADSAAAAAAVNPAADQQQQIASQQAQQAQELSDYSKTFRPADQAAMQQAMAGTTGANEAERNAIVNQGVGDAQTLRDRAQSYEQGAKADIATATGGNAGIVAKYGTDINNDVNTAVADARQGQTQALGATMRAALRYGTSIPGATDRLTSQNALQQISAANTTRNNAIDKYRGLMLQGINLNRDNFTTGQAATTDAMTMGQNARMAGREMKLQDQATDFGRLMDVSNLGRTALTQSQGAAGTAVGAGTSAANLRLQPIAIKTAGVNQGVNTIMSGRQLALNGLGGMVNSQTTKYNTDVNAAGDAKSAGLGAVGTIAGAAITVF